MLPEARAVFLKDALTSFDALGPELAHEARARMPAAAMREIADARPLDWLPASHALAILWTIDELAGEDGVRSTSVAAIEAAFRAPLLRAFVEAAVGVLGIGPSGVLRTLARAYPLHYRNAGELVVVDDGPGALHIVHTGLPPMLRERVWLLSLATIVGRSAALGADGAAAEPHDDGKRIVYEVRWPVRA